MMDAKGYIRHKFAQYYGANGNIPYTCLEKTLNDPRLKIELLPPPPRFEVHRASLDGHRWFVIDLKATPKWIVGTFSDQARAMDYAKWQNSLEEQ